MSNYKRFPGVVETGEDPQNLGRIKCSVIGVMQSISGNYDHLPWVYPKLKMSGKMNRGEKVWVEIMEIEDPDNETTPDSNSVYQHKKLLPEISFYVPMNENDDNRQQYIDQNAKANPEVMFMHSNGFNVSAQVFDETNGFISSAGVSQMQLSPDGRWGINSDTHKIIADENGIIIGRNDEQSNLHPVVLGDELLDYLSEVEDVLNKIASEFLTIGYLSVSEELFKLAFKTNEIQTKITSPVIKISTGLEEQKE